MAIKIHCKNCDRDLDWLERESLGSFVRKKTLKSAGLFRVYNGKIVYRYVCYYCGHKFIV